MAFQPILDQWRTAGETENADLAETALATLRSLYLQVLTNLDCDRQISQTKRKELLKQMILVDVSDAGLVEKKVFGFCLSHQCSGRKCAAAQHAVLGHVEERRKTEATLEGTAFGKAPTTRRNRSVALFLDKLLQEDVAEQRRLLGTAQLSRWIMWSFYQPSRLSIPFLGVAKQRSELIRRLGLGRTDPNKELLLWEHCLEPHQTAHKPTAFDAEAYDFFRPGGKTHPLSGSGGLHEVVHPIISGSQLAARIEAAS